MQWAWLPHLNQGLTRRVLVGPLAAVLGAGRIGPLVCNEVARPQGPSLLELAILQCSGRQG